jgi:hypothetical protein
VADEAPTEGRTCPTCGATAAPDARVCEACGTLLRAAGAGAEAPPHEPAFVHKPMFTGPPPDARPVAPPPPSVVAPPPVVLPPPRKLGRSDRTALGCGLAVLVVAAILVGAVLIVARHQAADGPAPLNTTHRTLVTDEDVRFYVDGTPTRDEQADFTGSGVGVFKWWTTEHAGWQEWVGVYRLLDDRSSAATVYDTSADDLAAALFDRGTIDTQRSTTIEGRPATWYRGSAGALRGGRSVSGKQVDDASLEYLITTFDDHNLIVIGIAWDPKHPPPDGEIEEVRRSFRVRN